MKKLFLIFSIVALTLAACSSDNGGGNSTPKGYTVTASSISSFEGSDASNIKTVKAVNEDDMVITTGTFKNDGFSLTLPATLDEKFLTLKWNTLGAGLSISDNQTKSTEIYFMGYGASGKPVGQLVDILGDQTIILYIYVDRNLKITGEYTYKEDGTTYTNNYNLTLSKGYNKVAQNYYYSTNTISYVCPAPVGVNTWYFWAD